MAKETTVNSQITDAVSQVNEVVGGSSEPQARAMADQVMAHAIGLAMQNAVAQQQQAYILRNAVTTALRVRFSRRVRKRHCVSRVKCFRTMTLHRRSSVSVI